MHLLVDTSKVVLVASVVNMPWKTTIRLNPLKSMSLYKAYQQFVIKEIQSIACLSYCSAVQDMCLYMIYRESGERRNIERY